MSPIITHSQRGHDLSHEYSTTINAQEAYFCEASEDGIDCQMPAEHVRTVNATGWTDDAGTYHPPENRYLCEKHNRAVLRLFLLNKGVEKLMAWLEEETPYTRADAEADLANAAYWDEVARRDGAA